MPGEPWASLIYMLVNLSWNISLLTLVKRVRSRCNELCLRSVHLLTYGKRAVQC